MFTVSSKEFGRGPAHKRNFRTLAGAARYVKAQWQGADYMNGEHAFHTDFCAFTLDGFGFGRIGSVRILSDGEYAYREFTFNPELLAAAEHRVVVCEEYRANPDYVPSAGWAKDNNPCCAFYTAYEVNGEERVAVSDDLRSKSHAMTAARAYAKKLGLEVWFKRSGPCSGEE